MNFDDKVKMSNVTSECDEFIRNAKDIANLNKQKKKIMQRQQELQQSLAQYLTSIDTQAIQYQDTIFSLEEPKNSRLKMNQKTISAYLEKIGRTRPQIDEFFASAASAPGKSKILLKKMA